MRLEILLDEVEIQGEFCIAVYDSHKEQRFRLHDVNDSRCRYCYVQYLYVENGVLIIELEEEELFSKMGGSISVLCPEKF